MSQDIIQAQKMTAAAQAVSVVQSNTIVGLGTGSTAILAVQLIGEKLAAGELENIIGIPTSIATEAAARELGIPVSTLEAHPEVALTIDGADEVDPNLNVIKGGGGALLREKIVSQATSQLVIIVDQSKPSPCLGTKWAIPIEVIPFGWGSQRHFLESLGAAVQLRLSDRNDPSSDPFRTDHGNMILDCDFGPIADLTALDNQLNSRTGIVEHGLFLNMVTDVIIAGANGIEHKTR